MASSGYAPSKPLARDPFEPVHDAAATVLKGYTGENAVQLINMLDWAPGSLVSVQKMLAGMAGLAAGNVHVHPSVAPMLAEIGQLIGKVVEPVAQVAAATRRVHNEQLRRIEEGQGRPTHQAWDISKNPL